jgi:hypothetical protein
MLSFFNSLRPDGIGPGNKNVWGIWLQAGTRIKRNAQISSYRQAAGFRCTVRTGIAVFFRVVQLRRPKMNDKIFISFDPVSSDSACNLDQRYVILINIL